MKKRGFIALFILTGALGVNIVDHSIHLLNQPSDFSVGVGLLSLLASFVFFPTILVKIYRRMK